MDGEVVAKIVMRVPTKAWPETITSAMGLSACLEQTGPYNTSLLFEASMMRHLIANGYAPRVCRSVSGLTVMGGVDSAILGEGPTLLEALAAVLRATTEGRGG